MSVIDLLPATEVSSGRWVPKTEAEAVLAAIAEIAETESFERIRLNPDGTTQFEDRMMSLIYRMAHAYTSLCGCHGDWKEEAMNVAIGEGVPWPEVQP